MGGNSGGNSGCRVSVALAGPHRISRRKDLGGLVSRGDCFDMTLRPSSGPGRSFQQHTDSQKEAPGYGGAGQSMHQAQEVGCSEQPVLLEDSQELRLLLGDCNKDRVGDKPCWYLQAETKEGKVNEIEGDGKI